MKKVIALALAVLMLVAVCPLAFAKAQPSYVLLGDSIAQGFGVYNRSQACYGRIVADTNGYSYTNYGVDGYTSRQLLELIGRADVAESLRNADIVSISIGGNDFLQQNIPAVLFDAVRGDYTHLNNVQANLVSNFAQIIETVKAYNPDAVILAQSLYNTHIGVLGSIFGLAVPRVNAVVYGYLEENPGAYTIVDVESAFKGHPEFVAVDAIHPTAEGNIEIARLVLKTLNELGLSENTEPVVNAVGIDEIPYTSIILKRLLDFFRKMFVR